MSGISFAQSSATDIASAMCGYLARASEVDKTDDGVNSCCEQH